MVFNFLFFCKQLELNVYVVGFEPGMFDTMSGFKNIKTYASKDCYHVIYVVEKKKKYHVRLPPIVSRGPYT